MDSTRVEIISKQLDTIVESLAQHPAGLTSGQIALTAAAVGASAAILSQLFTFFLTRFKERTNLKKELVAEERRIAFLQTEYFKEIVMHKVHKQYWYRTSELHPPETTDSKDSHERHFQSNQRSFEAMSKLRVTTSEYFKIVTHFTIISGQNKVINQSLADIKLFKPRKASDFAQVGTYNELLRAHTIEEDELNKVYLYYSDRFDIINAEMTKKV